MMKMLKMQIPTHLLSRYKRVHHERVHHLNECFFFLSLKVLGSFLYRFEADFEADFDGVDRRG